MFDSPNKWRVAGSVTRLILLRIEPGREIKVGRLIESRCRAIFASPDCFKVFRLFGSYDLLVIQDGTGLGSSDFVNLGSLPYVTGSIEYVCNKWRRARKRNSPATFVLEQLSSPLLAICFLKINPELTQRFGLTPELSFASYIQKRLPSIQMLSTFGWAEAALLISEGSLDRIFEAIGDHIPRLMFDCGSELPGPERSFAEKTLTIVGHSLDISDPSTPTASRIVVPIGDELRKRLNITFSAACKPRARGELEKSAKIFRNRFTEVSARSARHRI